MGLEDRALGRIESARKQAKGRDQKILARKLDRDALKRALEDNDAADLLKLCFGTIERGHYSRETTVRLMEEARKLLEKLTDKGSRLGKKEQKENYYRINNELSDLKDLISKLDKKQESSRREYMEKTGITLECIVDVLENLARNESIQEGTRAEIACLSMAVVSVKILLAGVTI